MTISHPKDGWSIFPVWVIIQFSSVTQSCPSLWPHELQHARLPCPSPNPRAYSSSCPLSRWGHPTISSSVSPFSHLQSFPASRSFQMSQFFTSDGQIMEVSALASVLPLNIQDWLPLGSTGWISLLPKGLSSVFSNTRVWSISSSALSLLSGLTLISVHDYWKNHSFNYMELCGQSDVSAF